MFVLRVYINVLTLCRYIPVSFKDSYTPIAAAGTHTQVHYDIVIHYVIMMS